MAAPAGNLTRRRKNVKVFTRMLPSVDFSHENIKVDPNFEVISVRCLQDFVKGFAVANEMQPTFWSFTTDGVFYNASQEDVYGAVMEDVVNNLLSGQNVILMCYGQTGSGKSFTASGLRNQYEHRGLAPRLLGKLFEQKCTNEEDAVIRFELSFVEVVGREVKDLLATNSGRNTSLRVPRHNISNSALVIPVQSEEEGLKLMFEGENCRCFFTEAPYSGANMGHSILTIHIENTSLLTSQAATVAATVHILDLAGIDSPGKLTSLWKMPRDIGKANITKSILQHFLSHLNSPKAGRLSPVIRYLGETLSKESILRLVGHIRATDENLDITLSTLRFGERVSGMKCKKVKISNKPKRDLQLQTKAADVEWLRGRVELCAMLGNQTDWKQNNLPPYRVSKLHDLAGSYISNEVSDIRVRSVMQNIIVMQDFKEAFSKMKQVKEDLSQKLVLLAEESELAREKALVAASSKLSKKSSSATGSVTRSRGKKASSKTLAVSERSNESVEKHSLPEPTPQVGKLENWGITIGPGIVSGYQGEATKASKRVINLHQHVSAKQERKIFPDKKASSCLSLQEQFRCAQEFSSDSESESKQPLSTPDPIPTTREQAWEEFLSSGLVYVVEMQTAIERSRMDAEEALKKHIQCAVEIKEMCFVMDQVLHDLLDEQHQRHISGKEEYDVEGLIVVGDDEKKLVEQSKVQEAEITLKKEELSNGLMELNECVTKLNDAKKRLEEKFEEFFVANLKNTTSTETELRNKQLEVSSSLQDPIAEQRSKYYQSLQQLKFGTSSCKVLALQLYY